MKVKTIIQYTIFSFALAALSITLRTVSVAHRDQEHMHHWEIPSLDPDRIVLTVPNGQPSTSAAVTWRTSVEVNAGMLQIAKETGAPRFDLNSATIEATTETVGFPKSKWNHEFKVNYHSASVENLEPDTLYCYRVGNGGDFWSEWIQFRTATADPDAPITFLYFGDAQNSVFSHWSRVVRGAYKMAPHAHFSLHAGDLINRAHHDTEWAEWFHAGGWIHSSVATVPVAGNHEYSPMSASPLDREKFLSMHWRPQFNLPVEEELPEILAETVYTVKYPNLLVVVLNSNRERDAQVKWIEKTLQANTRKWVVLSFHHPIFSSGEDRDNEEQRAIWKPIFEKYKVDLVLQGHDHTYARGQTPQVPTTLADVNGHSERVNSVYINSVSGPKMYHFQEDDWDTYSDDGVSLLKKAENTQFFQVITVNKNHIHYEAYTASGALYDAFKLLKADDGSKWIEQQADTPAVRVFDNTDPYHRDGMDY